ncbi:MAG: hypothetical protein VYA83_04155 [Candidatus Neomarinimicrobiota bacterium]|jgi:hypothetical protein|nr:hypothetical protein [Candidatus Neomarinimicrobiota bacterium]MEC7872298.1 hypothetical protein [Candidatus Neomarinimicrobiota bacterium]MEC9006686.1 hypothetical protein [Candidatus Neomarinimicrobiota bacterium]MEC9437455.1 hypothetical protein [Candidatus Neomarinimicrobiota bacterium]MEC9475063.1 hypothetical protein [Candidatus Neomarinimicrobiota bacterium]|tara:strand:- start:389 stop:652 length:264 start_codon:yes stop_codon:yes gene_type:complete
MCNAILETMLSASLFIFGGNIVDTKLGLHHFEDDDYSEIFYQKHNTIIVKNCTRHSELENIKKLRRHRPESGGQTTVYKITKTKEDA